MRKRILYSLIILISLFYFIFHFTNRFHLIKKGNIIIPSLKLEKTIILGMTKENLDLGYITLYENQSQLDAASGNIILAGHARKGIFGSLKYLKQGDSIYIVTEKRTYYYYVEDIFIHMIQDNYYIDKSIPYRQLILITCTDYTNERLIVIAKEK